MIKKETVDLIHETARIDEVVGDFVSLKKRGANLLGLCPFHNEKTPSFTVSPAKGIYKCFGCGKGGNSVNFIMDHEQLSYPEALKYVANKYNIEIEERELTPEENVEQQERESLFVVSAFAQKYFSEQLLNTDLGKSIGLGYLQGRGIPLPVIEKFQLGYSPEDRTALAEAAKTAGYKKEYLVKTGLCIENERGIFDRFAGRVMFPIHNISGRVIAFGGRTLKTDKKVAKYVNSPESPIYHKSKVLYGIYQGRKMIVQEDQCFLVEGYTDVIAMHMTGIENVVASSGTSLTVEQIRLIRRYTKNITILFDGDAAGIKASLRGVDLILEEGMNVKVLLFPDGDDPDSYSKKHNPEEVQEFIKNNGEDFIRFKTGLLFKESDNDPIKKASLIKDIVSSIAKIPEAIQRSVYVKECSRIMEIQEQILLNELNKLRRNQLNKRSGSNINEEPPVNTEELLPISAEEQVNEMLQERKSDHQERDIIRILLHYGDKEIAIESIDDDEKPISINVFVAQLIVHELEQDGIELENPAYRKVFDSFAKDEHSFPSNSYFTSHEDQQVSSLCIDLLTSPHSLSENWGKKHNIIVETEEAQLKKAVLEAINALKARKLELMIEENLRKMKEEKDDAVIMELQKRAKELDEIKKSINSVSLGRVIVR